jgi:hypothetical protein
MVKLLLGLAKAPAPHDAADALAVAICHMNSAPRADLKARLYDRRRDIGNVEADPEVRLPKTWRQYRPPTT